ncbi:cyclin-like protein [Acrodontium crateriforme]|uniref:RNA polymerase II holoenzyme cyclin-like subunit n=1 Tax=Acrodontium crateriforme TaxID=150365 RepID=A0AAQ3M4N5_9PEZI|nr:cyclin-like protein [Acrodontium crateriforme]
MVIIQRRVIIAEQLWWAVSPHITVPNAELYRVHRIFRRADNSAMTAPLSEDDIYRTSSQYRLWFFSPENLAAQRAKTRELAIERARHNATQSTAACEYLTAEEELRLVQRYCEQIRTTSDHFKWPITLKATAVQYLKRFYTSNSCITYPPKEIYKTVLFLACKAEGTHMTLSEYARRISTEKESILAPEYKVMQALRFTLEVKHAYRGLKGVLMELLNMAAGTNGEGYKSKMMELALPPKDNRTPWRSASSGSLDQQLLNDRIQAAYAAARTCLDAPALLTDVYFLYTPSQILFAALHVADEPLVAFYLDTKLPATSELRPKILSAIHACAAIMAAFSNGTVMSKDERALLEEKLELCRDSTTRDLVKKHANAKVGNVDDEEERAKRRKMEREKHMKEGDDLFGATLSSSNGLKG